MRVIESPGKSQKTFYKDDFLTRSEMSTVFDQRKKAASMKLQSLKASTMRGKTGCMHKIISI